MVPRENKNNAYVKFGTTNKEYYGIFRNGLLLLFYLVPIHWRYMKKYCYKNNDTFETEFTRHASVVRRPSSVESRINLKYI